MRKVINAFVWFIFALSIFTTALSIMSSVSGKNDGDDILGYKFLIVNSDSMSKPQLSDDEKIYFKSGDLIIISTTKDKSSCKVGDVITFISKNPESYGKTVTHKISEVKTNASGEVEGYSTYGVFSGEKDKVLVTPDTIIGVYQGKIENLGALFSYLQTPSGYYLSILIPVLLLIVFFSIKIGKFFGRKELAIAKNASNIEQNAQGVEYNALEIEEIKKRLLILEQRIVAHNETAISKEQEECEDVDEISVSEDSKEFNFKSAKSSFIEKLSNLEKIKQDYFNEIHNELNSYGVRVRLSFKCISYRFKRKLLAKITISGKTLRLHLALNVSEFNQKVFFQKDLSSIKAYGEVPFMVKIKSDRGKKNALKLINELMQINEFKKIENSAVENLIDNRVQEIEQSESDIIESKFSDRFKNANKKSFSEKLSSLNQSVKEFYEIINNELLSYKKVKERKSFKCASYRLGKRLLAKITVRGKTLRLHLALNVSEFNQNAFFQKDLSSVKAYSEVPFTVKIKSQRAQKNAIKLICALMSKNQIQKIA